MRHTPNQIPLLSRHAKFLRSALLLCIAWIALLDTAQAEEISIQFDWTSVPAAESTAARSSRPAPPRRSRPARRVSPGSTCSNRDLSCDDDRVLSCDDEGSMKAVRKAVETPIAGLRTGWGIGHPGEIDGLSTPPEPIP